MVNIANHLVIVMASPQLSKMLTVALCAEITLGNDEGFGTQLRERLSLGESVSPMTSMLITVKAQALSICHGGASANFTAAMKNAQRKVCEHLVKASLF